MNEEQQEIVIEPAKRFSIDLKELWQYRELFYFFTWRDIKVKYKQTVLGILWVMLQPLLLMVIFTFFFGKMLKVDSEGMPYPVFAFSGIVLWSFFSAAVTNAGTSMVLNAPIIKKIYFPRLIIPLSSILAAWVDLLVALIIFIGFLFFFPLRIDFVSLILLWPAAFLLSLIGAMGLGCWLSALVVKYRDFRFVAAFVMQVAFFLTPIVYPVEQIGYPYLKYFLAINPMYGAITLFRLPLMTHAQELSLIWISVFSSLCLLMAGLSYFKKTELYFADLA